MAQSVSRLTHLATRATAPLAWLGEKAYTKATITTRFQPSELQQRIADARASGEDLAADSTRNYIQMQWQLFPYRVQKLKDEIDAIKSGNQVSLSSLTYKEWVRTIRFFVRLMFLFMFGVIAGRNSIYPLIAPNSIFAKEQFLRPGGA